MGGWGGGGSVRLNEFLKKWMKLQRGGHGGPVRLKISKNWMRLQRGGEGGSCKTETIKEMHEAPEGWVGGRLRKNPLYGRGMDIFWNYYEKILILVLLWKNIAISFLLFKVFISFEISLFNPRCKHLE